MLKDVSVHLWSDSNIVLAWLKKHPAHWKTFVANRVSIIQTEAPAVTWRHVATKLNPADLATRGTTPLQLKDSILWWKGPDWLSMGEESWESPEEPIKNLHCRRQMENEEPELLTRFGSWTKMIRIIAYCRRPLKNLRSRKEGKFVKGTFLTCEELEEAKFVVIRLVQQVFFNNEIEALRKGNAISISSRLRALNPFLDFEQDILRVGGRLSKSELSQNKKHPPILPRDSAVSKLFVLHAHTMCMHGGPTLTISVIIQQFWILGQRQLVKRIIRNCVRCQRIKPKLAQQLMGDLPKIRTTPARPFTNSGLDYAGPFQVRTTKGRGNRTYKCYVVLFICFSSRAIHLELAGDLTTQSFLAAFRRFISRRGRCKNLFSDNATTFRGANSELQTMFKAASNFYTFVSATLANDGTTWTFIPPTTPHYGGLWEAGIKSVKHLLTYEEFSTVLTEVEACLNSRPICPMSSDVEDLNVLTPAHFLIGENSALIPDEGVDNIPENRLGRFQLLQRIRDQFWRRWMIEYVQHLQQRGKWRTPTKNFGIGELVLVSDDRYPPSKWPLGRIVVIHPGTDGCVRVVEVKMAGGIFKRHIARLSPLFKE